MTGVDRRSQDDKFTRVRGISGVRIKEMRGQRMYREGMNSERPWERNEKAWKTMGDREKMGEDKD